jgi:hypothetical protein
LVNIAQIWYVKSDFLVCFLDKISISNNIALVAWKLRKVLWFSNFIYRCPGKGKLFLILLNIFCILLLEINELELNKLLIIKWRHEVIFSDLYVSHRVWFNVTYNRCYMDVNMKTWRTHGGHDMNMYVYTWSNTCLWLWKYQYDKYNVY